MPDEGPKKEDKVTTFLVPQQIGLIGAMVAEEGTRYGLTKHVRQTENGDSIRFEATDGRIAVQFNVPKDHLEKVEAGRFPDIGAIVPKNKPIAVMRFNANLLEKMLRLVQSLPTGVTEYSEETDRHVPEMNDEIFIEWHGEGKPSVVRAGSKDFNMVGLIMPMGNAKDATPKFEK